MVFPVDFQIAECMCCLLWLVADTSGDAFHNEEDPPPFYDNHDFGFGLDNKTIRRAFIRKVGGTVTQSERPCEKVLQPNNKL